MARYRQPYTYYIRPTKSGKGVYYYQTYDEEGQRTPGISTGKTTKADFLTHMTKLIKADKLLPDRRQVSTFASYTQNWWCWGECPYIAQQLARNPRGITQEYAKSRRSELSNHLLPTFGPLRMIESRRR